MYGGELWTLKYLSGFKWSHLKEKIGAHPHAPPLSPRPPWNAPSRPLTALDKRMRAAKMRQQIASVRAETAEYTQRADMAARLARQAGDAEGAGGGSGAAAAPPVGGAKRGFNQLTPLDAEGRPVAAYAAPGAGTADGFDRGAAAKTGGRLAPELLGAVFGGKAPKKARQA